ncbi:MAG: helix-turn-helix transcriptional regulator [Methanobrevibacter sp.]|nr:helix-turn-helix transcriptional regulator [Methanobrevibacter sp.]
MYNRLKDLREDEDKSQKEIAQIINTSCAYYGAYELGKRDIPFERVIELAKYYDVSLDYIAGRTNDKGGLRSMKIDQDEKMLLDLFHRINRKQKNIIIELLCILGQKEK